MCLDEVDCDLKYSGLRIARNSWLLRRFATKKLDILGVRYEFMN